MSSDPPVVLVVAGNDPSGGAGIAADIQAITAAGAHPAPVITALTVQDTVNASAVEPAPPGLVADQMRAVLEDVPVAAVKIGLLATAGIAAAVAAVLDAWPDAPLVLDPVLVAAGGARLSEEALVDVLLERLCPRTCLFTPNAHEIRRLAQDGANTGERARILLARGCGWVLAKGGDEKDDEVVNRLYGGGGGTRVYRWPRLPGTFHGSGCTLASACAARLAFGDDVPAAVEAGQALTQRWLAAAFRPGRGQWIPRRRP